MLCIVQNQFKIQKEYTLIKWPCMHSHLASLTIELLSFWSVVLVDDSTQIIKSRFIDFFVFLFSRNKLTCTLLVYTHVLSYWLWSILQFILHCTGNSIFFGSVLLFCARSFWYLYYNVPVYRHIKITSACMPHFC